MWQWSWTFDAVVVLFWFFAPRRIRRRGRFQTSPRALSPPLPPLSLFRGSVRGGIAASARWSIRTTAARFAADRHPAAAVESHPREPTKVRGASTYTAGPRGWGWGGGGEGPRRTPINIIFLFYSPPPPQPPLPGRLTTKYWQRPSGADDPMRPLTRGAGRYCFSGKKRSTLIPSTIRSSASPTTFVLRPHHILFPCPECTVDVGFFFFFFK